jgi:hypothetical protein
MNVNKKLGRFKQWAGEKMGGEIKTGVSDEFKALELEMDLRHAGKLPQQWQCSAHRANAAIRSRQDAEIHDYLCQITLKARRG